MIGLIVDVELVDGSKHSLEVTWGVAYRWQLSHPNTTMEEFVEKRKIDDFLDLAWEAYKSAGLNPDPIHLWVDKVKEVKFAAPKEAKSES